MNVGEWPESVNAARIPYELAIEELAALASGPDHLSSDAQHGGCGDPAERRHLRAWFERLSARASAALLVPVSADAAVAAPL